MRLSAGGVRRIFLFLSALGLILCGAAELSRASFLWRYGSLVSVEPVALTEIEKIRTLEREKESGQDFTAWTVKSQAAICDTDGARHGNAYTVIINGTSELLFPYGKILQEDDKEGCLIGAETADRLFGSRNVEGMTFRCGERELTVRGVLEEPSELLVYQARDADTGFSRITLMPQKNASALTAAERFAAEYGLTLQPLRYDLFSRQRMAELIPGKWSDFDGWRQKLEGLRQDAALLLSVEKSSMETMYLARAGRAALCCAAGVICLAAVFGCIGGKRVK